jgi:hypothetical protein
MAYTVARIGAVVALTPQDYFQVGKRSVIRFREKGGKEKEIPVHHNSRNTSSCDGLRGEFRPAGFFRR